MAHGDIVWDEDARKDFAEYLETRNDQESVLDCVEQHILGMADLPDPEHHEHPLKVYGGILPCKDGDVQLYLRPAFYTLPDGTKVILGVKPLQF